MIDVSEFSQEEIEEAASSAKVVECDSDPKRRALAAYFRGGGIEPPSNGAIPIEFDEKLYLVLSSAKALLAVYRVRNDLQLKRLRRVPLPVAAIGELIRVSRRNQEEIA